MGQVGGGCQWGQAKVPCKQGPPPPPRGSSHSLRRPGLGWAGLASAPLVSSRLVPCRVVSSRLAPGPTYLSTLAAAALTCQEQARAQASKASLPHSQSSLPAPAPAPAPPPPWIAPRPRPRIHPPLNAPRAAPPAPSPQLLTRVSLPALLSSGRGFAPPAFPAMAAAGKKLINDPNDVVVEFIQGLVETYPNLVYLDGFPEVKVVLRADVVRGSYDKVAVISGGGSGHEPAHAGYVGVGMLTAAICGDVFTSPPCDAILAGIRAVTGPPGCLLVVKNYTGDRLHFGLAAEQAKAEGYKVEMVIVGDDCALPPPRGLAGRRGLAGTLFVHKVAGAAAAAGLSLQEVAAEARRVSQLVGTMGVALTVCTLPGQLMSERLGSGEMELGLGIHGERGAKVDVLQPVDYVVSNVLKTILSPETQYTQIKRGSRVALMVNSLGATPLMEVMIAAGRAVAQLQLEHGLAVERVYSGTFMTSLDMAGLSLSVLKVDDGILQRLDSPTRAPAWPVGVDGPRPPTTLPVPLAPDPSKSVVVPQRPQELTKHGLLLEQAIRAAAEELIKHTKVLNDYDSKVGDGDCGITMAKAATAILDDMKKRYPLNDDAATVNEIGASVRRVAGGTSGVLYDIFFRAAYVRMKEAAPSTPAAKRWSSAFETAVKAVSTYGGATAGQRTLLDAFIPASAALKEALARGEVPAKAALAAAGAAEAGAESTKSMQAQAGRSSYVPPEVLSTVPDPGAVAAAAWIRAAAEAVAKHL